MILRFVIQKYAAALRAIRAQRCCLRNDQRVLSQNQLNNLEQRNDIATAFTAAAAAPECNHLVQTLQAVVAGTSRNIGSSLTLCTMCWHALQQEPAHTSGVAPLDSSES